MKIEYYLVFLAVVFCFLHGCVGTPKHQARTENQYALDQQIYEPYKLKNTVEGYEEFIAEYPGNQFVGEAKRKIYRLKYDQYLKMDTIEGYREFIRKNPDNPHVKDAFGKIESIEFRRCEKDDTLDAYKYFVAQYPKSYFIDDAKFRIREIEFKQLDEVLRKKFGFDLLKYRLVLRRLKRDLILNDKESVAGFECDAEMTTYQGKTYFLTNLVYNKDFKGFGLFSDGDEEDVFDAVVSEALLYLQAHFRHKGNIAGFGFKLSLSSHSHSGSAKYATYFPVKSVSLFCQNVIDKKMLKEQSFVVPSDDTAESIKAEDTSQSINTGIRASDGVFNDTILVLWSPANRWSPTIMVDGYRVYRAKEPNGIYEPVRSLTKGYVYYDKDIQTGEVYYYRVLGYRGDKAVTQFGNTASGRAASDGVKGPIIIQGEPLKEGTYTFEPFNRENPTYQFAKNGACIENIPATMLKGRWRYDGSTLVIETGKEELRYSIKMVEKWEDAFTTHSGRHFHRMGIKQVPHIGIGEVMKFIGNGHVHFQGTGRANRKKDMPVNVTAVLDKSGIWHTTMTSGEKSSETNTPHSQEDFQIVEYNGNYFLSMPDKGPGYFRQ